MRSMAGPQTERSFYTDLRWILRKNWVKNALFLAGSPRGDCEVERQRGKGSPNDWLRSSRGSGVRDDSLRRMGVEADFRVRTCWAGSSPRHCFLFAAYRIWFVFHRFTFLVWLHNIKNKEEKNKKTFVIQQDIGNSTKQKGNNWWFFRK